MHGGVTVLPGETATLVWTLPTPLACNSPATSPATRGRHARRHRLRRWAMITRRRFVEGLAIRASAPHVSPASAMPVLARQRIDLSIGAMPINITGRRSDRHGRQRLAARADLALARRRHRDRQCAQPSPREARRSTGTASSCRTRWMACRASASRASRRARPSPTASRSGRAAPTGITAIRGFQEQTGLYGPLVIEPQGRLRAQRFDRDYVVMLSDWTDEEPDDRSSATSNSRATTTTISQRTLGTFIEDARREGLGGRRSPTG